MCNTDQGWHGQRCSIYVRYRRMQASESVGSRMYTSKSLGSMYTAPQVVQHGRREVRDWDTVKAKYLEVRD
eukprot:scaffold210848_cov36-Tisochrysis_lutea.AAC.1